MISMTEQLKYLHSDMLDLNPSYQNSVCYFDTSGCSVSYEKRQIHFRQNALDLRDLGRSRGRLSVMTTDVGFILADSGRFCGRFIDYIVNAEGL